MPRGSIRVLQTAGIMLIFPGNGYTNKCWQVAKLCLWSASIPSPMGHLRPNLPLFVRDALGLDFEREGNQESRREIDRRAEVAPKGLRSAHIPCLAVERSLAVHWVRGDSIVGRVRLLFDEARPHELIDRPLQCTTAVVLPVHGDAPARRNPHRNPGDVHNRGFRLQCSTGFHWWPSIRRRTAPIPAPWEPCGRERRRA